MSTPRSFLVAGAQRSGTTLLCELLDRHPQICLARPLRPEPKHFLDDRSVERGPDGFFALFPPASRHALCGEKSTSYLEVAAVPQRVRAVLPAARILFCLRDPVARAISNYRFSVANRFETAPPADALLRELTHPPPPPPPGMAVSPFAYLRRGRFAELLAPWERCFPRRQIAIILFEHLVVDPASVLARVWAFLGVDPAPPCDLMLPPANASAGQVVIAAEVERLLAAHFAEPNRTLAARWQLDLSAWPSAQTHAFSGVPSAVAGAP
jgi:LPS sulfotransferase NodH